jgi:hypothetical protein
MWFWALVYIAKVYARQALNRELVIEFRYAIQPNRTPDFSGFAFPARTPEHRLGWSFRCHATALLGPS